MTPKQTQALDLAKANDGAVFAGYNVTKKGSRVMVAASTLRALEKQGLVTLCIGPDGGMMARVVTE